MEKAPEFSLPATPDQRVSLADFRGSALVLVFYPADWSPVCSDELAIFNEIIPDLKKRGVAVVGISVDGPWCHVEFARQRKLHLPLLADFEPKGAVARAYGAYRASEGVCERALVLVDKDGFIRWRYVSPVGVNPGVDGVLDAIDSLEARP